AVKTFQAGGGASLILGQDFDGDAPPHEQVLAKVDGAHAALPPLLEDLIFADLEAAITALHQLLRFEIRQEAVPHQYFRQRFEFFGEGRLLTQVGVEACSIDQSTLAN